MKMVLKVIGVLLLSIPMGFIGGWLLSMAIHCAACVACSGWMMTEVLSNVITILCILGVGTYNVLRLFGK